MRVVLSGNTKIKEFFPPVPVAGETQKGGNIKMKMKTLGIMRIKIVRMILRVSVAAVLLGIPAISAVADGPGPVPYPKIVPAVQR